MAWKDVRITDDAHKAAKMAATSRGERLDIWMSIALLKAAAEVLTENAAEAVAAMNGREAQEQR